MYMERGAKELRTLELRNQRRGLAGICRRLAADSLLGLVELLPKLIAALFELLAIRRALRVEPQDGDSNLSEYLLVLHVEEPVPRRPRG